MNAENWQKIKIILEEALEISPEERPAFLEKSCGGDENLRGEVANLLEFEKPEADLLEQAAVSAVFENGSKKIGKNFIGRQIGNYKITEELGAGGMGAVFLAERNDGAFRQKAALKLIKRGMDSDSILRRFYNERQILASLEHPNIAHLVDGGTTDDDLPYFVMEYVEGEPITEYVKRKNLSLEERLKLFREVCAAVSFAHQNLIIHRDLKPSNILITTDGKTKLLDFGIAKFFKSDSDDAATVTEMPVFTPEYASPEQIGGEKLTTATDVYSLGVILYELLTGKRPYKTDSKNIAQIVKAVCETEPPKPSAVGSRQSAVGSKTWENGQKTNPKSQIPNPKSLKGDLDNIILKALRKEPLRRYSSVEQFSEDIRRHLVGLPVSASKDTWNYRTSKFVQRNKIAAAAAALVLLVLIGGISATLYQAKIARRERAKAEKRFDEVRGLANSFVFEINDEMEKSPVRARELLVRRALEYLDNLSKEAEGNTDLQSELAAAYEKIGSVQAEIFKPTLGKTAAALISHQKSLEIREKLYAAEPENITRGLDVVKSRLHVGDILSMSGQLAEAHENYRQAVVLNEQIRRSTPNDFAVRQSLYRVYARLGQTILRSGSLSEALENYERSKSIMLELIDENPNDRELQRSLGIIYSYIGYVKIETGAGAKAERDFGNSLEIMQTAASEGEDNIQTRGYLSTALLWHGVSLSNIGKRDEAFSQLAQALEIQKAIFAADRSNLGEQNALGDCYLELGRAATAAKKPDAAIENLEEAIKNYETVWQADSQNFSARRQAAFARRYLADAFRLKGENTEALEIYEQTLKDFEELTRADPNNDEWKHDLAVCHLKIAEVLIEQNNRRESFRHFKKAESLLENLVARSPENIYKRQDLETVKKYLLLG